jgi:hypothetical protein
LLFESVGRPTVSLGAFRGFRTGNSLIRRYNVRVAASARLFHTIVVLGAAITAPHCGRTGLGVEANPSDLDASDDVAGVSGAGGTVMPNDATYVDNASGVGGVGGVGGTPVDAHNDPQCVTQLCAETGAIQECGDCVDNDSDGKLDLADPECATPCSTEGCPPAAICPQGSDPCDYVEGCSPPCPASMFCITGCCVAIA